jgi:hypothetical protein
MRRLAALVLCGALLAGCSGGGLTPHDRLQDLTAQLVEQTNARDVAGARGAAADLRQEIEDQVRASQLSQARAQLLLRLIAAVERDLPLLTEPSPTPTPSETPSPTPSPTATVPSLLPTSPQASASP